MFSFKKVVKKEINIILLGESGVGKSTFINALANYFKYSSFEDAENGNMKYLIPAYFTVTDENYNQVKVEVGDDENESREAGKAATQSAKSHYIDIGALGTLHIIDTPGIGDPEGFSKDKENFRNTMNYISTFESLNGICVLLKPNNARLDLHFRYCFKELLVHLHKNAAPNIVFCFTNSRSTFYRPGDTLPALEVLVRQIEQDSNIKIPFGKENIFCFDNESFRFLMALQKGVTFSDSEKADFSTSWKKSVSSSNELLAYVTHLPLHEIKETVKLNEARYILMELARPIAEISQNIQINIKLASDKKNELESGHFTVNDLQNKLMINQIDLQPTPLGYPRTVCTAPECTKVVQMGEISKVDYVTHCHPHCYLDGVKQETINNQDLKNCACMGPNAICNVCSHDWSKHMHITYENQQVAVQVIDQNIQDMIDQKVSNQKLIEAAIDSADQLVQQLESEQKILIDVSARFAHFTRQNAIAVFNDDLDAYLDLLIREEEAKKQAGANNEQVLNGLRDVKANYIAQKNVFDQACNSIANQTNLPNNLQDIDGLIKDLYNLPLSGDKLKNIVDNLKKISKKSYKK